MKTIKCLWCGLVLPLTRKGRPKQHRNGAKTCSGSGVPASQHETQRKLIGDVKKGC